MEKYYVRLEKLLDSIINSDKMEYSEKEELLIGFAESISERQFLMKIEE